MEQVLAATTLPTLLLGGDPDVDPELTYDAWERALALPGVRGLVVGRALLYPPDGDVAAAVDRRGRHGHGASPCLPRAARDRRSAPAGGTLAADGWDLLLTPEHGRLGVTAGCGWGRFAPGGELSFDTAADEAMVVPLTGSFT